MHLTKDLNLDKLIRFIVGIATLAALVIMPNLQNTHLGARGYEIAKVNGIKVYSFILILLFILYSLNKITKRIKKTKQNLSLFIKPNLRPKKFQILLTLIVIANLILSNFTSKYQDLSIYGNFWREQGLITYLLLLAGILVFYFFSNSWSVNFVLIGFLMSGILQSIIMISQIHKFIDSNGFEYIFNGYHVNGGYGQTNFVTYTTSTSLIILVNLIKNVKICNIYRLLYSLFLSSLLSLVILATIFSGSIWTIVSLLLVSVVYLIYKVSSKLRISLKFINNSLKVFLIFLIILPVVLTVLRLHTLEIIANLRFQIWDSVINYVLTYDLKNFILGIGFDSLGDWFRYLNQVPGYYVDRAHNIFLDTWLSGGILSTIALTFIVTRSIRIDYTKHKSNLVSLIIVFWIIKLVINEFSICNILEFFVLLSCGFLMNNKRNSLNDLR